jgi:hypothetical protein
MYDMESGPALKQRARELGLRQRTIAALLGSSARFVGAELHKPRPAIRVALVVVVWGMLTPAQRFDLLTGCGIDPRRLVRQRLVSPSRAL